MKLWDIWDNDGQNLNSLFEGNDEKIVILSPQESELFNFNFDLLKSDFEIDIVFGGYDKNYYNKYLNLSNHQNVNLFLWPTYFMYEVINRSYLSLTVLNKQPDIKCLFTNMNGLARHHRVYLMDLLVQNKLLENNFYSWHEPYSERVEPYKPKYWKYECKKLQERNLGHEIIADGKPLQYSFPKEMDSSLLNLVTETNTDCPFLTEKTFKNFLYNKPFLIYGCAGIHSYLKSIGFKLHDDIFNYEFDNELDHHKRGEMLVQELVRLSSQNLNELHAKCIPVLEHNRSHMIKLANENYGIPEIIRNLQTHNNFLDYTKERLKELL